jgi:hypothetical protein
MNKDIIGSFVDIVIVLAKLDVRCSKLEIRQMIDDLEVYRGMK